MLVSKAEFAKSRLTFYKKNICKTFIILLLFAKQENGRKRESLGVAAVQHLTVLAVINC